MKSVVLQLCVVLGVCAAQDRNALKAGLARVEITPAKSMEMYGYANRKCGPSNGTHDGLFAKALVLEAGDTRIAIVTMDLGSFVSERLKDEVASKLHIPLLLVSASHTHSAPAFLPYGSAPVTGDSADAYLAELEQKVFSAVKQASESLSPAELKIARGSIQLGYNRLLMRDDGRARALFQNPERIPYGPVDPEFTVLRIDDLSGKPRAMLVHYGVHAVVLGQTNCKYSADYPGVLQARLEQEFPGSQAMFVQGGAGDINPLLMARSGDEAADFGIVRTMGETLAAEVIRANRTAVPVQAGPIRFRTNRIEFRNRWDQQKKVDVGLATVLIGNNIAIATVPGEPMHALQKAWKTQAEVPYPLFYGYTYTSGGTWAGYVPDLRTAARGGYGADVTTTVEVGAGERIVQQHLMNLYDLLGMWHADPGKP